MECKPNIAFYIEIQYFDVNVVSRNHSVLQNQFWLSFFSESFPINVVIVDILYRQKKNTRDTKDSQVSAHTGST